MGEMYIKWEFDRGYYKFLRDEVRPRLARMELYASHGRLDEKKALLLEFGVCEITFVYKEEEPHVSPEGNGWAIGRALLEDAPFVAGGEISDITTSINAEVGNYLRKYGERYSEDDVAEKPREGQLELRFTGLIGKTRLGDVLGGEDLFHGR